MIREKLKTIIKKIRKSERIKAPLRRFETGDLSLIPPVQPGNADMPDPKSQTEIGHTWLSAQIVSGVSPTIIDARSREQFDISRIPGAVHHESIVTTSLNEAVVYDQGDGINAEKIAKPFREQGHVIRCLVGGFDNWLANNEATET